MITIIGIGADKGDLTLKAAQKIAACKHVFLRTAQTVAGADVLAAYPHAIALDPFYDEANDFDALLSKICEKLIAESKKHAKIAYLTDGDGLDGIAELLKKRGAEYEIIYGVAPNFSRSENNGELRISASDAVANKPYLDTSVPLHVTEIDDKYLAGELKLWLMNFYGDEILVTVSQKRKPQVVKLCDLDRLRGYDYSCELYIDAQKGFYKERYSFGDLLRIMDRLTAQDGCPWDKAQTHESIRINMIEEAYEAVDAIDGGDTDAMVEELGDVLLQSVFHCNMGERFGEFSQSDAIGNLCSKLVHRHTHIFGENKAKNAEEALGFWENAKSEEKSYVSTADKLNRLPECFPSLLAAEKIYKKLAKANAGGFEKLLNSINNYLFNIEKTEKISAENYAKTMFVLAALMAQDGLDAEVELNKFNAKIKEIFTKAEQNNEISDFFAKL